MKHINIKEQLATVGTATFLIVAFLLFSSAAFALDTLQPTIDQVYPANNEKDISTNTLVAVRFSEPMNPSTINEKTFTIIQKEPLANGSSSDYRTNEIKGTLTLSSAGLTATFTPSADQANPLQPSQRFGNVFTATITSGAEDLAGNPVARDYVWSFTTGLDRFNTGASTSQSDQSANIFPPEVAPVVSAPVIIAPAVVPTASATTSAFPWAWVLAALIVLALIVLFLILSNQSSKHSTSKKPNPFGDVHPVIDLEGIGPKYEAKLANAGIHDTRQLWNANASQVAKKVDASTRTVQTWQNMAELSAVKDIGPQYSELLERSGIHSIEQLTTYTPERLLALVRKKQASLKVNIQGSRLGESIVSNWIDQARAHEETIA